jgi:hypothetical protein
MFGRANTTFATKRTPGTPMADPGTTGSDEGTYEIRIRGYLDARWTATFGISSLTHEIGGTTVLRSVALDQPALHGLLERIRDLSLPLISVIRIDPVQPTS